MKVDRFGLAEIDTPMTPMPSPFLCIMIQVILERVMMVCLSLGSSLAHLMTSPQ